MKTIIRILLISAIACSSLMGCTTKSDFTVVDTSPAKTSSVFDEHLVGVEHVLSYIGDKKPATKGAQSN